MCLIRIEYTYQRSLGVVGPSDNAIAYSLWERAVIANKFKSLAVDVSKFNGVSGRQTAVLLRRMVDLWNDQKGRSAQREGAGGRERPEQHDVNQSGVMVQKKEKSSECCDICEMLKQVVLLCGSYVVLWYIV